MRTLAFLSICSWIFLVARPCCGQTSSQDIFKPQRNRMEQMRKESNQRMQEMRNRHNKFVEDAMGRSNQRMEEMQAEAEEFRTNPDAFFETARKDSEEFENAMREQQSQIREYADDNSSSSGGRRYRIRGRTIKGLIMLLGLLGAGAMKVFGFFGGSKHR